MSAWGDHIRNLLRLRDAEADRSAARVEREMAKIVDDLQARRDRIRQYAELGKDPLPAYYSSRRPTPEDAVRALIAGVENNFPHDHKHVNAAWPGKCGCGSEDDRPDPLPCPFERRRLLWDARRALGI